MGNLSARQLERIELLKSLTGSIKTPFEIDAVETVNELRGKSSLPKEQLMEVFNKTVGSVKLNHEIDSVQVIKELRGYEVE